MTDPTPPLTALQALGAILLGGVLGTAGQGIRAIIELNKAGETAQENQAKTVSAFDLYVTGRLVFSLLVGFVIGVIATLMLGLGELSSIEVNQTSQVTGPLLTILLAGYAGTDAVEGFITRFLPAQP